MLGVRLPEDIDRRLSLLASKTKRPKSFFVKEALTEYLDEYESMYEAVFEYESQKKKGTLKLQTLNEIMQEHGLSHKDLDAVPDNEF